MASENSLPPPSSTASRISPKIMERAINALLKWRNSKLKTEKPQLLEQDDFLYLILTLKKIPQGSRTNPHKIPLPHSLVGREEDNAPELCLIIDDRPKSNLTKDAAMKKIKNDSIPITKVIKITKLKTDYRPFEAKRKLCDSYDLFFADKRVVPLLPKLLGKQFFKKKKIPVPVDLKHQNWKEQIDKACGSAFLYLRTGTCSVLKVGKVSMGVSDLVENVLAAINGVAEIVPRKWGNIRSFHVKLLDSLALPVYQAVPDMKLKIEGVKVKEEVVKKEELDKENVEDGNDEGTKRKSKKKGRIHEVRYMDSNIGEVLDEDELGSDDGEDEENSENGELDSDGILGKKRKKGVKEKIEKLPKKVAKVKKDELSSKIKNEDVVREKKPTKEALTMKKGGEESNEKREKKKAAPGKVKSAEMKVKDKKQKKKVVA